MSRTPVVAALIASVALITLVGCAAPSGGGQPPTGTPSSSSTASGTPTGSPAATGCEPNDVTMPSGAVTAQIGDIDGDGRADTEWYAESPVPFSYGVTTASGATFVIPDTMAGPNTHSGWTATGLESGQVITVVDDGRGAQLYSFLHCAFVTPIGVNGEPYTFDMENLHDNGTGVWCRPVQGGLELDGVQALLGTDGAYVINSTRIIISADGRSATNGGTTQLTGIPADDPRVHDAQRSSCGDTPIVSTSGR